MEKKPKTCSNCRHSVVPKFQTSLPGMLICMKPMKRKRKNVLLVAPEYASICKCRSYAAKEETKTEAEETVDEYPQVEMEV